MNTKPLPPAPREFRSQVLKHIDLETRKAFDAAAELSGLKGEEDYQTVFAMLDLIAEGRAQGLTPKQIAPGVKALMVRHNAKVTPWARFKSPIIKTWWNIAGELPYPQYTLDYRNWLIAIGLFTIAVLNGY